MKKRLTVVLIALNLGINHLLAGYTVPESGKVYRIHNVKYEKVIGEDAIARQVTSVDATDNSDFSQLWVISASGNGYLIQNAYSGQYLSHCSQQSSEIYPTTDTQTKMNLTKVSETKYAIGQGVGQYLHLDNGNNIARWWDKDTDPSQWQFEEVSVSNEAISLQQAAFKKLYAEYLDKLTLMENLEEYNAQLPTFFVDNACTELSPTYKGMSDQDLRVAMSMLPTPLQNLAIKIKNQEWGHREQEFRIRSYKAYSDADYWAEKLYTKKYSRINNPTGIYGRAGDVLYIFVDNDITEGATLQAEIICGSAIQGTAYNLKKGLNMIPTPKDYSNVFIQYIGETSLESSTLITDYPKLKIHIEEGVVNGFWDKEEHNDEDWVDMMTNLATADMFQVKGERIMFHMSKYYMNKFCPNTISDAIGWWDDMTRWQQDMLGIEDVRLTKFNNLGCAISLTSGYQSATHYRTQYLDSYIGNLLPYENMMSNADNCWGPAHENGHVHQAAIQSVGTSEVSNNFFSNLTLFKLGRYTSRGSSNDVIFADYVSHKPYILRDGASTMRSFWQLYLYFHEAKADTTFYPRVLQAMRATPLKARNPKYYANHVYGNEDLLLFAKVCCDVAQMDLSEFFRFWGYLEITNEQHIGDYGDFYLTTRESDVKEFLDHASQYPKAPSIIFIEDRIKAEPRTDGIKGDKLHHLSAVRVGEAGDVGHYTDFKDTSIKAEGYIYDKNGATIQLSGGTGAVGFKVYTKEDYQLITASNRLKFNIPEAYKMHDLIVVAAQADGTDVTIKSRAEGGSESEQLAILKESLSIANEYAQRSDDTGTKIGFFYPEATTTLKELIEKANYVIEYEDQSEKTYGAWAMQLNSVISALYLNHEARISIVSNCYYSLGVSNKPNQNIDNANAGLKTVKNQEEGTPLSMQWKFVNAETEGTYYIQHRVSGNYISEVTNGKRVKAEASSTANAVAFILVPDSPGDFFIQAANDETLRLYSTNQNQNYQVCAGNQTGASAKWNILLTDNMLSLPEISTEEKVVIYYMMRIDNGEYAYSYLPKSRDKGRIATAMYGSSEDMDFWFYFKQGSEEGKYTIHNFSTGKTITKSENKLYIDRDAETVPEFTIALNEQGTGFVIADEEGEWLMKLGNSTELAEISAEESTTWKLQRSRTISLANEPITSLTINKTEATLYEGDRLELTVETAPVYATDHTVTWSSSNEKVATVDANGKVTAIVAGSATITATANDGSGLKATCKLTVKRNVLTSLTISKSQATITQGETITLSVKTAPTSAPDHSVTWTSSDEKVATVDADGKVTAIAEGNTTITATANDGSGLKAICNIKVEASNMAVTSTKTEYNIDCRGGVITIDGLTRGYTVSVYNMVGKQIATTVATGSRVIISTSLDKGSIMIISMGTHCVKMQMK